MADEWYIDAGGSVEGPLSAAELHERAAAGRLQPGDSVSADRLTWAPAATVEGLPFSPAPRRPLLETVVAGNPNLLGSNASSSAFEVFSPLESLPGYEIQGTLGTGACGVVLRAVQVKLNRVVALKTVRMPERTPPEVLARFDQEAVSLARLHHPNVVAVYDCGHSEGRAYFAMEMLDGEDLAARLGRDGPLDERTAWFVARQTAAALAHAAKLGVIHRDVKPANLFLVPPPTGFPLPDGVPMVKVTDFGLALTRDASAEGDQRQTAAGMIIGTPVYMAPEQFTGRDADPRADIYSLGVTVYHMLAGQPPFDGRTVWDVMAMKSGPPPRLQPPVSAVTADLVAAMMANDPSGRPADYSELLARIDALPCLEDGRGFCAMPAVGGRLSSPLLDVPKAAPTPATAPPKAARGRKWWLYAVATPLLLGVGLAVAALVGGVFKQPTDYNLGDFEALYDGTTLRWLGKNVLVEDDDEKVSVLQFEGSATRALKPVPNFQVAMSVDLYKAAMVDVVVATAGDSPGAVRWLVRLDTRGAVAFGKQVNGVFEPVGTPVPFPAPKPGQPPYLGLEYQRADGVLSARFDKQSLGQTPVNDLKTDELRIEASGGPVRIQFADFVELVEKK